MSKDNDDTEAARFPHVQLSVEHGVLPKHLADAVSGSPETTVPSTYDDTLAEFHSVTNGVAYWICVTPNPDNPSFHEYAYVLADLHSALRDDAANPNAKQGAAFNDLFARREALQAAEEAWKVRSRAAMQRHIRAYYTAGASE